MRPLVVAAAAVSAYIDSHCHLEVETYGDELPAVIARARAQGLAAFIAVGASRVALGADEAVALARAHPDVYCAVGIHPNEAAAATSADEAKIARLLGEPKVVALGEVGLDYYYGKQTIDVQRALFERFIAMAQSAHQPLMMHVREAHEDCLAALDAVGIPSEGGVIHCFTGGPDEAEAYLARGLHLSIPGVVTFKNAGALREAVAGAPLHRLLVETDCPYLAPVPKRGKRNEPAYVAYTAQAVADLQQRPLSEVAAATTANARRLFRLPEACGPAA